MARRFSLTLSRLDNLLEGDMTGKGKKGSPPPSADKTKVTSATIETATTAATAATAATASGMGNEVTIAASGTRKTSQTTMDGYLAPGTAGVGRGSGSGIGTPVKRPAEGSPLDKEVSRNSKRSTIRPQDGTGMDEGQFQDSNEEDDADEETWRSEIKEQLASLGTPAQNLDKAVDFISRSFEKRIAQLTNKVVKDAVDTERSKMKQTEESNLAKRSVIIHNADQWVKYDGATQEYGLAERVTSAVGWVTKGMVAVTNAFTLGRWDAPKPPTAVMVTFGSETQKGTFYKVVAKTTQGNTVEGKRMRAISCRDAFPKKLVPDAIALAQKGKMLKDQGKVASFRVVGFGPGCIPILQVRDWLNDSSGRRSNRWTTYIEAENSNRGRASDRGRAKLASLEKNRRTEEEEKGEEEKGEKEKTPRRPTVPVPKGTPRKILKSTRLSYQDEDEGNDDTRRRSQVSTEEEEIVMDEDDELQKELDDGRHHYEY